MTRGRSLELYFADGTPDGILTAEVFGWTGHVLRIPRLRLADGLRRREATFTGTYLLLGEQDGRPRAYVGEAESVVARIRSHDAQKDWWSEALILTTSADNHHKAHVRYIEARLVQLARAAGNADLDNGNDPVPASLTEAQQANMEEFLDTLQMVLPALGVDLLKSAKTNSSLKLKLPDIEHPTQIYATDDKSALFELCTPKSGVKGTARLEDAKFVVEKGSTARKEWIDSATKHLTYGSLHRRLLKEAILEIIGAHAIFTDDYIFSSPSAAAAVLNGRSTNGREAWREQGTGRTLNEWEAEQLKDLPS
jgi:hypothetical protein